MHMGHGHVLGERAGEQGHTLNISELPAHSHSVPVNTGPGDQSDPTNNFWANDPNGNLTFGTTADATLSPKAITNTGGSQAHLNMMPFLTLNFCIALQGIFPSQS